MMENLFDDDFLMFPTNFDEILQRINRLKLSNYGRTRNYIDGAVSYLSPYISRGVISTKFVYQQILQKVENPITVQKFVQELAWRDYWQQVWIAKGNDINNDLKNKQSPILNQNISLTLVNGKTGIKAIDTAILDFYKTGYLHNHVRMYIASISCNITNSHWKMPAKWMYYHLLDADWASNALSWQWVAGSNSNKKYYANQENINKYCYTHQKNTFLDVEYSSFPLQTVPESLLELDQSEFKTPLPQSTLLTIDNNKPTLIYNFYNLDPLWKNEIDANRVLLLEPYHFKEYPISKKTVDFVLELSKNIKNIKVFVGEFSDFENQFYLGEIYFKEHPLNKHYKGIQESRDWIFDVHGYFPSFFSYWKKCKKQIRY